MSEPNLTTENALLENEIRCLQAEIERLRAALRGIADRGDIAGDWGSHSESGAPPGSDSIAVVAVVICGLIIILVTFVAAGVLSN